MTGVEWGFLLEKRQGFSTRWIQLSLFPDSMKQFDPKSLFLLSDKHFASAGRLLGDPDMFPILYVLHNKETPISATQLSRELGISVADLLPILNQLVSGGLAVRRGRAYQSNEVSAVTINLVREIVKDVSLNGTETSCN